MRYRVTFDRIGAHRPLEPVEMEAAGADELRLKIHEHAESYVPGWAVCVHVSFVEMCGEIERADHRLMLGTFKIEEIS